MKPMSVLDAAFLQLETAATPMHVGVLLVLDPPARPGRPFIDALREHLQLRLASCEIFTRRLALMPFDLASPLWLQQADADLDYHVRSVRLRRPVTQHALEQCVARLHARPLDRNRPLWEAHVVEGLPQGRLGLYVKLHHAGLDGASAQAFMRALVDGSPPGPGEPPDEHPAFGEVIVEGLRHQAAELARLPGTLGSLAGAAVTTAWQRLLADRPATPPTPHTRLNKAIGSARNFAGCQLPLADVKALAHTAGGTVNDVVLAVAAGALRRYLQIHDDLPAAPLAVAIPVSLRAAGDETQTIQVTFMATSLHTDIVDRTARFAAIRSSAQQSKALLGTLKSVLPRDLPSLGLPWLLRAAGYAIGRPGLVERAPLPFNVLVSNVPGPAEAVSIAGRRVRTYTPVSIAYHGLALNVTVHSYDGQLFFGLIGCRKALPDLELLARGIVAEFRALARGARPRRPGRRGRATRRVTTARSRPRLKGKP